MRTPLLVFLLSTAVLAKGNNRVDDYLRIQDALASDNWKAAQSAATNLSKSGGDKVAAAAKAVAQSADIKSGREKFKELSTLFIAGALPEGTHLAYCPMAEARWIQKGSAIRNPYYGKSMLTCGVVEK